jgi:hypothetical protein
LRRPVAGHVTRRHIDQMQPDRTRPLFMPTPRQLNWLIAAALVSVGYALYLRYLAVEFTSVGLACQAGSPTWLCFTRKIVIALFTNSVFGVVALGAALLNLIRPSPVLFAIGLVAAGFGIVLYNVELSALAAALLVLSLARPRPLFGTE